MLQQLESLADKAKITILVDKDNGKMDVVILLNNKDAAWKKQEDVFNPIFLSADAKSIDEQFNNAIKDLIAKDSQTKIEPVTEPKKEKVVSKATKKEIVQKEPIRQAQIASTPPPPPTKNKATGTLTPKLLSQEEIDAIEDSFARPEPDLRPRTPQEAFEVPQLFAEEKDFDDCDDCGMQDDSDLYDDVPEEVDYFEGNVEEEEFYENPTKTFVMEQAESKGIPKKMVEEKVIFATIPKAPPIDDMELQAKDPMEQMKKNNGENYLNRRGKFIVQQAEVAKQKPTLKDRWDAMLKEAHTHGMKTDGLVFEQQTEETIEGIKNWIKSRIEAKNKL